MEGLAGCFESFFDLCRVSGRVAITENNPGAGRAVCGLTWAMKSA